MSPGTPVFSTNGKLTAMFPIYRYLKYCCKYMPSIAHNPSCATIVLKLSSLHFLPLFFDRLKIKLLGATVSYLPITITLTKLYLFLTHLAIGHVSFCHG